MVNKNWYAIRLLLKYKAQVAVNTFLLLIIAVLQISAPLMIRRITRLINDNTNYMYALGWFFASFTALYFCKFIYQRFKLWFCEHF